MKGYIQILFLTFLSIVSSYANDSFYQFEHVTNELGLSTNQVNCFLQDASGFMWIGTSYGLNRYDGYHFKIFQTQKEDAQSISNNYITSLAEDSQGNIWIGTRDGLNCLHKASQTFSIYKHKPKEVNSIRDNYINALTIDSEQKLWIGTNSGLDIMDVKSGEIIPLKQTQSFDDVIFALLSDEDQVWIGSQGQLSVYNTKDNTFSYSPNSFNYRRVTAMVIDNNNLWFGTKNTGIHVLLNKDFKQINSIHFPDHTIADYEVSGLAIGKDKNLYIAELNGGLTVYNTQTSHTSHYEPNKYQKNSISSKALTSIYRDKTGIIWVGTHDKGINMIDNHKKKFRHYGLNFAPGGLFNSNVRSIFEDKEKNIWIGTKDGGGLSHFDKRTGKFINYQAKRDADGKQWFDYVFTIDEIDKNNLILGTRNGCYLFNKRTEQFQSFQLKSDDLSQINSKYIYELETDLQGRLWATSQGKLVLIDVKRKFAEVVPCPGSVNILHNKDHNHIWAGTYEDGLFEVNTTNYEVQPFQFNNQLKNNVGNRILSVKQDSDGLLFIGTDNGLCIYNPELGTPRFYKKQNGLAGNQICNIQLDKTTNSLWLSTNNGLSCFYLSNDSILNFNVKDGLQGNEFSKYVGCKTQDGEMLFGGINGFNYFKPEEIVTNKTKPQLVFTGLRLFNKTVEIGDSTNLLSKHISCTKELRFTHKQSVFTIEFVGLSFSSPQNNEYAYMLENFETDWNYCGAQRWASYTNLKPGEYLFKVKAANNDGLWNNDAITMRILIRPPFWKQWWFIISAFLFLSGMILLLFYLRLRNLKRQQILLERTVAKRTQELQQANKEIELANQSKLRFFTNITHEFRTPLTLILGPLDMLIRSNSLQENSQDRSLLEMIQRNSQRLLHLINNLMEFRKMEQGKTKLELSKHDIVKFLSEIKNAFNNLAKQRQIAYSFKSNTTKKMMAFDPDKMEMIAYNLLSNAFKFTPKNGTIDVRLYIDDKQLNLSIQDNGRGIEKNQQELIFERFMQAYSIEDDKHSGTGIGLALTKELIELHGGDISLQSAIGKGSCFVVKIPFNLSANGAIYPNKLNISESSIQKIETLSKQLNENNPRGEKHLKGNKEGDRPTVLIIDDNEDIRHFISSGLAGDFDLLIAEDGAQGVEMAETHMPNLIISDIVMPKMNGFELCDKIKTNINTSHIPVILLTAYTSEDKQIEGYQTGADDYIGKPFSLSILKARIENLLTSRKKLNEKYGKSVYLKPKDIVLTSTDDVLWENMIAKIEQHMSDPEYTIELFCKDVGMSYSSLNRKLLGMVNLSVNEFIKSIRLKRAAQLLEQKELLVSEVMYEVGFQSKSSFLRNFRKQFDVSPSEYAARFKMNK